MKHLSYIFTGLIALSLLAVTATTQNVSAAASSCEALYSAPPSAVGGKDASDRAAELLIACHAGYEKDVCDGLKSTRLTTKAQKESACKNGQAYRKVSPPANTSTDAPQSCADITTNVIKCDTNGGDPVTSLLLQILNFLAVGVGIAVLGGIIWGGMLYASSNGDSGKVNQGKTAIVNSIIGLLLFIFMYAILNFIVPGGLFR